jgi:hypothetical protein
MPPKPLKPSQSFSDKRTYIPPRVQQALDRHAAEQPAQFPPQVQPSEPALSPDPPPAPPPAPLYPPDQAQPQAGPTKEYEFIVNPEKPVRRLWQLPGGNSLLIRALLVGGGLLVLIIIFVVVKNLLGSGSNATFTAFVGIAQDQQELIHLTSNTSQQTNITTSNKNFAATAQLALGSSQAALGKYLATNGHKVNAKTLNLKVSASLDNQLVNAATAATYDQTFQQIAKTKLTAYMNDLQQTYKLTKGKNGRALLNDDYNQAQLLMIQLDAPVN